MKDYISNELKSYIVAIIMVYFVLSNDIHNLTSTQLGATELLLNLMGSALFSSSIYIFTFVLDSVYGSSLKEKLLFGPSRKPGETIFETILGGNTQLSCEDIINNYWDIYWGMPKGKRECALYQNQQWYNIYKQYKDDEHAKSIASSAKEYRLCRDIFISTINVTAIYLILCCTSQKVHFVYDYICVLVIVAVLSNISARNKAKRLVYNVIIHDIFTRKHN